LSVIQPHAQIAPAAAAPVRTTLPAPFTIDTECASVLVLSRDRGLVEVVKAAAGARYPIHIVEEWPRVLESLRNDRANVVLLDADLAGKRLGQWIREIKRTTSRPVISVAARRDTAERLNLVSDRSIHRLLIKPAPLGSTRLLLESAANRYLQLRELGLAAPRPARRGTFEIPRWPRWAIVAAIVSLFAAAGVTGGLMRSRVPSPSEAGAVAALGGAAPIAATDAAADRGIAAVTVAVTGAEPAAGIPPAGLRETEAPAGGDDTLAAHLRAAAAAAADGRIIEPVGDSAIDRYAAILDADPGHPEASRQLDLLLEPLFADVESALLEGSVEQAANAAAPIRRVRPSSGRLSFLEAQIAQQMAAAASNGSAAAGGDSASPEAEASELQSLLTIARVRLQRGQLSAPRGDSALDYFGRAAALEPDNPEVQAVSAELGSALAAAARLQLERGDLERAGQLVDLAAGLDLDGETRALLNLTLATARQRLAEQRQTTLLASGIERLETARLTAPEGDSALFYLSTLRSENPGYSGLEIVWNRMLDSMEANVVREMEAQEWLQAETWLGSLITAEAEPARIEVLRDELEFRRRQADFLATPAAPGQLQAIETVPIEYPAVARNAGIEGWVQLEYVVDTDGVPTNVSVVEAEPAGWFEDAAIKSIAQYRYTPYELDGKLYARRAGARINFDLR
jgi:TonB family protein